MEWCFIGTFIDTGGLMEEVRQVDQQEQHGITRESKMDRALADRRGGVCRVWWCPCAVLGNYSQ